jgi:DNA-binding response OmpR family regulator
MGPTRVLHVEDDKVQRALIAYYLVVPDEHKYVVTGVESEQQAVDTFRHGGVDLVILDYQLAEGDGLNCLRQLRELDSIVPVIALSGAATPSIAAELIEAGADDYLSKQSMDKQILSESIETALARAQAIRAKLRATALLRRLAEGEHPTTPSSANTSG